MFNELFRPFKKKFPAITAISPQTLAEIDPELAYDDEHPLMASPDFGTPKTVLAPPDPYWVAIIQELCGSR